MRATAGIHPHDAKTYDDEIEKRIAALAARKAIAAVGETGLDYYYEHSPRDEQKGALARQLALADRFELPVVLHCRDAEADLRDVLESERSGAVAGVVHCFTGTYDDARWYIDKGLLVSFTGIITFKNADALRDVVRRLPLDRIMVETDSPYLAPAPHRGKRNEPAFVAQVAEAMADIRGADAESVAEATTANALALFFA
jgi:TatD DNase family protein